MNKPSPTREQQDKADDTLLNVQIARAYHALVVGFERVVGVTTARFRVLHAFGEATQVSQAYLQQQLGLDSSSITRQVKAMEAEGLVVRRPDPVDNRFTLVSLTDQGQEAANRFIPRAHSFGVKLQEGCSREELAITSRMIELIRVRALALEIDTEPTG